MSVKQVDVVKFPFLSDNLIVYDKVKKNCECSEN